MEMYSISGFAHKISMNLLVMLLHIIGDWKVGKNITQQGKALPNLIECSYISKTAHISLMVKILTWTQQSNQVSVRQQWKI